MLAVAYLRYRKRSASAFVLIWPLPVDATTKLFVMDFFYLRSSVFILTSLAELIY